LLKSTATKQDRIKLADSIWQAMPAKCRKEPDLVYYYAEQIMSDPARAVEVQVLIEKTLKKTWDKNVIRLYGQLVTDNPSKQLAHAESWLKRHPNQGILLLTLARLSVRCKLWGKARSYFEDSLKYETKPETYVEYGKLLEYLGDSAIAMQSYRDGLLCYTKET